MLTAIRQWVIKTMTKGNTGVVQTMPKPQIIEMNVQITAQRLMQNGINPNDLKTVGQVENVVNQIEQPKVNVNPGMTSGKKADVLDMQGNKLDSEKPIMGGTQETSIDQESFLQRVKKAVDEDRAIKARLDGDNKKGIETIKINLVDDSIAKIKSMEPMDAMKEANLVAGKKGRYANLDDNQVNKIIDDTNDHIFERDIPDEDFATGGRVGLKGGTFLKGLSYLKELFKKKPKKLETVNDFVDKRKFLKSMVGETEKNKKARELKMLKDAMEETRNNPGFKFKDIDVDKDIRPIFDQSKDRKLNADGGRIGLKTGMGKAFIEFLKNTGKTMNDKNPIDLGKDYLKYIKDESIKGNSKKIAPGVLTIGSGGILANRYVGRRLEEMNKEQKMEMYEDTKKEFIEEYKNDPQLLEIMLKNLDDRTFGKIEEKADGGRIGLKGGTNEDFQKYLKERERFEKERSLEQLFKEYQEDLRRQEVGEQKQMAADGGRIGLKAGMTKRAFLKLMGSVGLGVGAAKSGLFSIGKGATKQAAKEVAQQTTSSMPPPYFFKLAEKIKKMGTEVTATTDRTISKSLLSKDGKSEYILEESVTSGDTLIKKVNLEGDNMVTDIEIMSLTKGEDVVTKNGKPVRTPDEYEEVTESNSRIYKDNFNDPDYEDGINVDEIIKEVDDQAPPIKYASGGLAYMLGE